MASFNELMQKMVNTDYDDLVAIAQEATTNLIPVCKAVDPDHNGSFMLISLILTAVAADGVLTRLEKELLCEVTGLDSNGIDKMISMYDSRMVDLAATFVDNMGTETKANALALITAFAAVDEKISRDETSMIKKLLS